ncbi:group II intron reverse transcriptase/maturase [Clostridioides difficile]|uniref:group II intron reverse transcriptase/maturase n=1 Tax=Clostridioides TaxID=1870884 RepID=UPI000BB16D46|nr:group II intron reverse transcriptase/maturase [Clostridioides difficile]MCC0672205.1 group II intron reverse transcriptase/maturase [Clostridioides sp. ES-S-0145-01]MCC0681914.1 group II intron reverse transcriptase/maturase [Clostridioides sp. ES-S-0005-03]MCC0709336.1 group II intron reverse transcriptase/maturase [Clostridioides sp. ES-S-0190-01]UDN64109.1 group II intron reverse transcriptase/maturase [Clostridioides sp. ES-W-0016-02]PBG00032.1 group II intron reverse transcriptase/mat
MLTSRKKNKNKSLKNRKIRTTEYYNMQEVTDDLYQDSLKGKNFNNLIDIISSEENIKMAYRNIKINTGSNTAGVDGLTIKDIATLNDTELVKGIKDRLNNYNPKAIRRVMIPKPNGKERPLGIPCIWDRLVQQCILQVLEPICEAKFHKNSNGFRPNKSVENAIAQTMKMIQQQKLFYVVDIDIKGFFDNVSHSKLKKQLWTMGIRDKNLLIIITKMLKAKVQLPNGTRISNEKGTPQGGILSPLLSNIVLNELDWWIASQWENVPTKKEYKCAVHSSGVVNKAHKFSAIRKTKLKEVFFVRYADDFKIFCKNYNDAIKMYHATEDFLNTRLKLEISPEKSKVTNLKQEKSEFLGFEITTNLKGDKRIVVSHMCDKAIKRVTNELKELIYQIKHSSKKQRYVLISKYNSKIIGVHNYYKIATCINLDCCKIQNAVNLKFFNAIKKEYSRDGNSPNGYIGKNYGKSRQMRYIANKPVVPIGYIKTKNAMHVKNIINKYTPEGREEIHKALSSAIDMNILHRLMNQSIVNQTIEYMDNRISVYTMQKGKCSVTGNKLEYDDIHCHHKKPRKLGGTDEFRNLTIVSVKVHRLIHATKKTTINKLLTELDLKPEQLLKINKLRKLAENEEIKTITLF